MTADNKTPDQDMTFTAEGRLRHENQFLKDRVTNLEVFKQNFFTQHYELIDARDRISQLEEQLNLDKLKQQISSTETQQDFKLTDGGGDLMEYFHSALTAASLQDLVMSLFQSADGMAKDIVVQIRDDGNLLDFCLDENIKAESIKLIKEHCNKEKVVQVGNRIILNQKHLSIIYSAIPDNPNISEESLEQYMEIISLGANTRSSTLKQRAELNMLRENIYKIFKKMNQSFDILQGDLEDNIIIISTIYSDFMESMIENLIKMKLDKNHLSLLNMILTDTKSEMLLALTKSMTLDKNFLAVLKRLEKAYAKAHDGS